MSNKKNPNPELAKEHALSLGLDWDTVKAGANRLLPIIEPIAKLTPNKVDDAFVAFVKSLLAEAA